MNVQSGKKATSVAWKVRLHRHRLECKQCDVVCERVVYPYRCLQSGCSAVYSYLEGDTTYFGCVHQVFLPELDLAAFQRRGDPKSGEDPYGPLRVSGVPRLHCPVAVEQAYDKRFVRDKCTNPTFFHQPGGALSERIRLAEQSGRHQSAKAEGD